MCNVADEHATDLKIEGRCLWYWSAHNIKAYLSSFDAPRQERIRTILAIRRLLGVDPGDYLHVANAAQPEHEYKP